MRKGQQKHRDKNRSPRGGTPERREVSGQEIPEPAPSLVSWTNVPRAAPNSVAPSVFRDTEIGRKRHGSSMDASSVLFWIKNCILQWKIINSRLESAIEKRKLKAKEEICCAALAIVQKQGIIVELQTRMDSMQFNLQETCIHDQLDPSCHMFISYKDELANKIQILKEAMVTALQQIPMTEGAVLGEDAECPNVQSFAKALTMALTTLQCVGKILNRFAPPPVRSPRSRATSRSPSPQRTTKTTTPLGNLEVIATAGNKLKDVVEEEVTLLRQIASLMEEKHKKQLKLNSVRVFHAQVKGSL